MNHQMGPVGAVARGRGQLSRRAVLAGGVAAGVLGAGGFVASAATPGRRVAVLGGGVGGLTAAHELAERGFEVTVYETRALGGKARSVAIPGTGRGGRRDLPGEHGFRFFPGFYHHLPDTLRRIPFPGNPNGVWDNLVPASAVRLARAGRPSIVLPMGVRAMGGQMATGPTVTADTMRETMASAFTTSLRMPPTDGLHFANRLLVYFTSCDARRLGQWENTSWREFIGADQRSAEYSVLMSHGFTSALVAAKERLASTRTIGAMGEQFLGNPAETGNDGPLDRVLNGPTNEAWLDPWVRHLRSLGVRFVLPATVTGLDVRDRRIVAARVSTPSGESRIDADHFVLAVPADRARQLWTPEILGIAPELAGLNSLYMDWMNGIQFFLNRNVDIVRGHISFIDSPWSLTGISQNQFWRRTTLPRDYGDGTVRDCLSVDISDWQQPGMFTKKRADECTPTEVAREVWAQVKAHFEDGNLLRDADLHSWALDPGITWHGDRGRNSNADPLLINTVGSWQHRPNAHTAIENLYLASDYVRTGIDLATMEGANEAARCAVNALLDQTGSNAPRCSIFTLHRAPLLEPLRQADALRYGAGLPNLLDVG